MRAYRLSTNLKLGLIAFAVLIAVASLWYTTRLVGQLKEREAAVIELWAEALEQVPLAQQQAAMQPAASDYDALEQLLNGVRGIAGLDAADVERYRAALAWARMGHVDQGITFIQDAIVSNSRLQSGIPAIVVDSASGLPGFWRNVDMPVESLEGVSPEKRDAYVSRLLTQAEELSLVNDPIPIVVNFPETDLFPATRFVQILYYGESDLVARLRWFPYIQLLFVGLFVLVGYFGFSYIRRSEQSSLWVGMAKEAAHQLGTPISSLMGWVEMLRLNRQEKASPEADEEAFLEIEKDIDRLERVTSRFSDIGSLPKLDPQPVAPVLETTADYMRRRLPQRGAFIRIVVDADAGLSAPINMDLFEWVIENLLKNALDAMEEGRGTIRIEASEAGDNVRIDVSDTGKGIDRRQWKNVFRPGYSTKKRGWGLGLSLAKRIIEDYHGGSLSLVASRLGEGTVFRIEIPSR
jgi:NtrC-family two-component system sensor histidine kinase KinB